MIVSPKELNELVNMKVQEQALEIERRILEKEKTDMENLARALRLYVDAAIKEKFNELDIKIRKLEIVNLQEMIDKTMSEVYIRKVKPSEATVVPCKPNQSTEARRRESSRRANRKPKPSS